MNLATLGMLDWVWIAILAISTLHAFMRGFLREIFSFLGLIAGILLASWYYGLLAAHLERWIATPVFASVIAFLFIVIAVMVVAALIGRMLRSGAGVIGLSLFDHLFGGFFGLLRGYLLVVACTIVFAAFAPDSGWAANSRLLPYFLAGAHGVSFVVPHGLEQQISAGALEIKHKVPDWIKLPE